MSTPSLEINNLYTDITHYVTFFKPGAQLQKIRSFRAEASRKWLFDFDFYPEPRRIVYCTDIKSDTYADSWGFLGSVQQSALGLEPSQNPLVLYLKSHFVGRRINEANLDKGKLTLDMGKGYFWTMQKEGQKLLVELVVPQKKPFKKQLDLWDLQDFSSEAVPDKSVQKNESRAQKKHQKLVQNIETDLWKAKVLVRKYEPFIEELKKDPKIFYSQLYEAQVSELQKRKVLPPSLELKLLKDYLNAVFSDFKRQKRKLEKASARLLEVQDLEDEYLIKHSKKFEQGAKHPGMKQEQKKPGLEVTMKSGLKLFVGKNSKDNDELLRFVSSKDMWFHVRGYSGAHVWLLRSENGLGKKDLIPQKLIEEAAKVALWNSKLKNSATGPVDYTEKRYLKKIKGSEGAVRILQSNVLFADLPPDFEKMFA